MNINLVEICKLKYPGEVENKNIGFRQPEKEILFSFWNVPNVEQPKESELMSEAPIWQPIFDMNNLKSGCISAIELQLDLVAKSRNYRDAITCASYAPSSNVVWAAESKAFIDWRDLVWAYAYDILEKVQAGTIPAPTIEQFMAGLPVIIWP